jgi:hypothetical protein
MSISEDAWAYGNNRCARASALVTSGFPPEKTHRVTPFMLLIALSIWDFKQKVFSSPK